MHKTDVLIIGSGLAALATASALYPYKKVTIVTKGSIEQNNSVLAQGGIAAAVGNHDSWQEHAYDTLAAGSSHCSEETVHILTKEGISCVFDFIANGMEFDQFQNGSLHFGREGAHRLNRILHAGGDQTGALLFAFLKKRVLPHVEIIEHQIVHKLICDEQGCIGAIGEGRKGEIQAYLAEHVVVATGGIGGLYQYTSNHAYATGDGLMLAYDVGAELEDLEFIQFHPTLLREGNHAAGLVSEAVRGEGGVLVTEDGERFMKGIQPFEDLSSRDIVARAVFGQIQKGKDVFLDISEVEKFNKRFPTIKALCQKANIHLSKNRIPVIPGVHFLMGGIKVNEHGETTIPSLYAVGEAACTGVHGANRLASNSLLECIVFGRRVGCHILSKESRRVVEYKTNYQISRVEESLIMHQADIQAVMMQHVGIIRNGAGLRQAISWFDEELDSLDFSFTRSYPEQQRRRILMLRLGKLIASAAIHRCESRGAHYRSDFPQTSHQWEKQKVTHVLRGVLA
ncbi:MULTISPECIES: L-aspartate oxidase [Priestia]|uniref:L-aspartate oxidase n=2 Tax=Priestia TaxID=2800373 RepID=A0A0V8JNA1_9BACI|nr:MULTISPECIES: L-aspartate oxidase [Priestia]KSU88523.1 L-aspartate oxidase [Priestia veravalensis]SCC11662.1 L-aspartate oxidase [Priestia flexa]